MTIKILKNGPQGALDWPGVPAGANGPAGPYNVSSHGASPVLAVSSHVPIGVTHQGVPVGVTPGGHISPMTSSFGATTGPSYLSDMSGNGMDLSIDDKREIFVKQIKKMLEEGGNHESIQDLVDEAYKQYLLESVIDS